MATKDTITFIPTSGTYNMFGRRPILSSVREITRDNVVDVLQAVMGDFSLNQAEISYLYDYYRGKQPVLYREKPVRPEICNRIVENRANEIVSFKVGYYCGEPIQYVPVDGNSKALDGITQLNSYMFAEDKAAKDQELVEWQMICGTAFRMVLPDPKNEEDEAPFELYTLDPRDTFVVYSTDLAHTPLMAVISRNNDHEGINYDVYTRDRVFYLDGYQILREEPHALGEVPVYEYPANNARLGAFEIVLPLLDKINTLESNRMDGIEQTVQAFIKFINCDISLEEYQEFLSRGAIKVKSAEGLPADVDVVKNTLDQQQSETVKEDTYNAILTICGMPNRNGGSSTSDTGAAVMLRDGWSSAEARAKDFEHLFKKAEKKMLRMVLRICKDLRGMNLKLKDIDPKFTRRNYEAVQSKAQTLIAMLNSGKVHPLLAFEHCGLFSDPESAYKLSERYIEEQARKDAGSEDVREDDKTQTNSQTSITGTEREDNDGTD